MVRGLYWLRLRADGNFASSSISIPYHLTAALSGCQFISLSKTERRTKKGAKYGERAARKISCVTSSCYGEEGRRRRRRPRIKHFLTDACRKWKHIIGIGRKEDMRRRRRMILRRSRSLRKCRRSCPDSELSEQMGLSYPCLSLKLSKHQCIQCGIHYRRG